VRRSRRKLTGQHFLVDRRVLGRIVDAVDPKPDDLIMEIGAGKGALTFPLAEKGARIIAVEKDPAFLPFLKKPGYPRLTVVEGDILRISFSALLKGERAKLAGNLPYVISSPILFKVLEEGELFTSCTFLLQKEVAQRICALPGTKKYAPLSILFQNVFQTRILFLVPPPCFSPPPKVDSALVRLERREKPLFRFEDASGFRTFLKQAFRSRRKKLANNLAHLPLSRKEILETLEACGIDQDNRPEQVPLSRFAALYTSLEKKR